MKSIAHPPDTVLRAYSDLVKQVFLYLRNFAQELDRNQLYDLSDAMHNIDAILDILPHGYTKTRRFGGWSSRRREAYVERCAILLESVGDLPQILFDFFAAEDNLVLDGESAETVLCPCCGDPMSLIRFLEKPRWCEVMASDARPAWYHPPTELPRRT